MQCDLLVIGLGYVGLPLVREATNVGMKVVGYDIGQGVVDNLNSGRSHVDDISDEDVARMVARGFRATTDESEVGEPGIIVICVPTPLSEADGPDLTAVRAASETAGRLLSRGMLVVLESTTYPGTTDELVRPILEKASGLSAEVDFHLAFSPERIDPGNPVYGLRNTPKVVGGLTPDATSAAARFYGKVCDQVVEAKSPREAEMAKLLENTYRHVNIALVNEMAVFCHELGIDLWDAIRCVELAQEINSRMPGYVVDRVAEQLNRHAKPLNGANVLVLGVTYKQDIADQRESPARPIARRLLARGAVLAYHDPYVPDWSVDGQPVRRATDLDTEIVTADVVVLLQAHSEYDIERIAAESRLFFDTRGKLAGHGPAGTVIPGAETL